MPKRTRYTPQQPKFTEPPLRGFLIHLTVFIVVIVGLGALNLIRNPAHPWFLWVLFGWGIAIVVHDLVLLIKFRPKRGIPLRPSTSDQAQNGYLEAMKGYVHSIEKAAQQNATFRTVLYTAKNCQLVVMSLKPGEDIGAEVHQLDQLLRVEEGEGKAVLDGVEHQIKPGFAILVPAGTRHNIINGPSGSMKLYTLYAPPNHRDGVVHATKADAEADKEHFDGKTTE